MESFVEGRVVSQQIHDLLVAGSLKYGGSWGGPECRAHVSITRHIIESSFWMLVCYATSHLFGLGRRLKDLRIVSEIQLARPVNKSELRILDKALAIVHFAMYAQLIYYKWNFSSLINLIQPCHVILLMEGIALFSDGPVGVMITSLILPSLSGTFLALLFPDTTGLDQPLERLFYWIQHFLIILIPIYLLQRSNGLAVKLCTKYTIGMGVWILAFLHFFFYEAIDLALNVNVEFMLCPTGAMESIFTIIPTWMLFPSYRTFMTFIVFIVGPVISQFYVSAAKLVLYLKYNLFGPNRSVQSIEKKKI